MKKENPESSRLPVTKACNYQKDRMEMKSIGKRVEEKWQNREMVEVLVYF